MVLHILRGGRPLCPLGPPRDWPAGHKWVSLYDLETGAALGGAEVCAECLTVYRKRRGLKT